MAKKVLIFSTAYLPLIGGAEVAVKEITKRLSGEFSFDLICARIKKELPTQEKIGVVQVYRVGRGRGRIDKLLLPWRGLALAKRLHRQNKYDLIWAIMASFGGLAALFFKKRFIGVPYVLTLQEGDTPAHIAARAVWLGPYWRQMFSRADAITAISQFLKDYAAKRGAKVTPEVIPNGAQFLSASSGESLRVRLNIKPEEKLIVHHGRLVPKNGLVYLVEAIGLLPDSGYRSHFKLLLIGSGPEKKKLEQKAAEIKSGERIIFLPEMPHEEALKYLAVADVFVRPSLSEGLGNVFLEAMAAGVPVIGTRVGGIVDFLRDGETGLFCEAKNPRSIAEKINLFFSDEILRQRLIANARKLVEEKYNWDSLAPKMENIFNRLIIK